MVALNFLKENTDCPKVLTTGMPERDQRYYLMEAIEKMGTVEAKANNNWKFVPEAWTKPAAQRDYELLFGKKK